MIGESVGENCGVAAISSTEQENLKQSVVYQLYKLLLNMQNRGQLSAGITTYSQARQQILDTHKDVGLVNEVFRINQKQKSMDIFQRYAGIRGIGHVRYATCGAEDKSLAQPFERHHGRLWKWFSLCFNGNIANYSELKARLLEKKDYHIVQDSDTEVMMHYVARALRFGEQPPIEDVFSGLAEKFDGAYNIAFLDGTGQLAVVRDPLGIRPMSYGKRDGRIVAASETNALASCEIYDFKALQPGEMLIINNEDVQIKRYAKAGPKAHCMFEWVYFSNVSSTIDEKSVYLVRKNLGKQLAKDERLEMDEDTIIVPVPETSKTVCDAMAYELGTTTQDGLIRNRFVGRTFIEGKNREDLVRNKFTVLKEVMKGKKVILVDDSIVRGTTIKRLVNYIKEVGQATEVHMRVACPPIVSPCFYGIDMSTINELFVPKYHQGPVDEELPQETLDRMAQDIGVKSLFYQKQSGLVKSIGLPKKDICMGCLNCQYPTECGKKLYAQAVENARNGVVGRTYECKR